MAVVLCVDLSDLPEPPQLNIPQVGVFKVARQSLFSLPEPSYFLMRLQDAAGLALAPLRRFMELLEAVVAIQNAVTAVIDAITQLSPQPIIDALQGVVEAIARLLTFIPPLSYLPLMLDLINFALTMLDSIIDLLVFIDFRLGTFQETATAAQALGDLELAGIVDCAAQEMGILLQQSLPLISVIFQVPKLLLTPLSRFLPPLKKLLDDLAVIEEALPAQVAAVEQGLKASSPSAPSIGPMMDLLISLHHAMSIGYNVIAPLAGQSPGRALKETPTLNYL